MFVQNDCYKTQITVRLTVRDVLLLFYLCLPTYVSRRVRNTRIIFNSCIEHHQTNIRDYHGAVSSCSPDRYSSFWMVIVSLESGPGSVLCMWNRLYLYVAAVVWERDRDEINYVNIEIYITIIWKWFLVSATVLWKQNIVVSLLFVQLQVHCRIYFSWQGLSTHPDNLTASTVLF
jgi:hypothetical protein